MVNLKTNGKIQNTVSDIEVHLIIYLQLNILFY